MITREEAELISKMALKLLSKNIELDIKDDTDDYLIVRSRDRYIYPETNDLYQWVDDQLANIRKNQEYYMKHYNDILSLNEFGIKLGGLLLVEIVSKDALGIVHCKLVDHTEVTMKIDIQIGTRDQLKEDYDEGTQFYAIVNQISYCGNIVIIKISRSHFNLLSELVKLESLNKSKDIEVIKSVRLPDRKSFVYVFGDRNLYNNNEFLLESNNERVQLVYFDYGNILIDAISTICSDYEFLDISCKIINKDLCINLSVDRHSYYEISKSYDLLKLLGISINAKIKIDKEVYYEHRFKDHFVEDTNNLTIAMVDDGKYNNLYTNFVYDRLVINGIYSIYDLYLISDDLGTLKYFARDEIRVLESLIDIFKDDNHSYKCPKCNNTGEINLIPDGLCPVCNTNIKASDLTT